MPYIRFDSLPDSFGVGRTVRNVTFRADTRADWVGEVDAVLSSETEIDAVTYEATVKANRAHNETLPTRPAPIAVKPSIVDILIADKSLDVTTRAALEALKG